jgi:hypothetical protein
VALPRPPGLAEYYRAAGRACLVAAVAWIPLGLATYAEMAFAGQDATFPASPVGLVLILLVIGAFLAPLGARAARAARPRPATRRTGRR